MKTFLVPDEGEYPPDKDIWILTAKSHKYFYFGGSPQEIEIKDVATALSNICRFCGQTDNFYSVAEHSIHVADLLPPRMRFYGLLHDAAEAFVGDVARPLKLLIRERTPIFDELEKTAMEAILTMVGLEWPSPEVETAIKDADNACLIAEANWVYGHNAGLIGGRDWQRPYYESGMVQDAWIMIKGWQPKKAREKFLLKFEELQRLHDGRHL